MNTSKHQYSIRCFLAFKEISINNLRVTPATAEFVAPIEVQNTQYDKMPIQLWYSRNGETESLLFDGVVTQVAPVKEKNKTLYSQVRCEAGVYNALKNTYLHTFTPEKSDPIREKINYNLKTQVATPSGGFNDTNLKAWLLAGDELKSPADILTKFVGLISHQDAEKIGNTNTDANKDFGSNILLNIAFNPTKVDDKETKYKDLSYIAYKSTVTDTVSAEMCLYLPELFMAYGIDIEKEAVSTIDNLYYSLGTFEFASSTDVVYLEVTAAEGAKTFVPISGDKYKSVLNAFNYTSAVIREGYDEKQKALCDNMSKLADAIATGSVPFEVGSLLYYLSSYTVFRDPVYAAASANSNVVLFTKSIVTNSYFSSMQTDVIKAFLAQYFAFYVGHLLHTKASAYISGLEASENLFTSTQNFSNFSFQPLGLDTTKKTVETMFSAAGIEVSTESGRPDSVRSKMHKVSPDSYFTLSAFDYFGENITEVISNSFDVTVDKSWYRACSFLLYYHVFDSISAQKVTLSSAVVSESSFSKINTSVAGLDYWRHNVFNKIQDGYKIRGVDEDSIYSYFCNLKKNVGQDVVLNHVSQLLTRNDTSLLELIHVFVKAYQHRLVFTFPKKTDLGYCEVFIDRDFLLNAYPDQRYVKYIPTAFTQDFGKKVFVSQFNYLFRINDENLYRLQKVTTPLVYNIQKNELVGIYKVDEIFDEVDRYYTSPEVIDISVDPTLRDIVAEVQTKHEKKPELPETAATSKIDYTAYARSVATKKILALYNQLLFSETADPGAPVSSWLLVYQSFMPGVDAKALADMVALSIWQLSKTKDAAGFKALYNTKCTEEYLTKNTAAFNLFPETLSTTFTSFSECCSAMLDLAQEKEAGVNYSLVQRNISFPQQKKDFYTAIGRPLYNALLVKLGTRDGFFDFMYRVMLAQLAGESNWGRSKWAKENFNYGGLKQGKLKFSSIDDFCVSYISYLSGAKVVKVQSGNSFNSGLKTNLVEAIRGEFKKNNDGCATQIPNIFLASGYIVSEDITKGFYGNYVGAINAVDISRVCDAPPSKIIVPTVFPGKLDNLLTTIKNAVPTEYWALLSSLPGDLDSDLVASGSDTATEEYLPFGDTVAKMLYTPAVYKVSQTGNLPDFVKPFSTTISSSYLSSGFSMAANTTALNKADLYFLEVVNSRLLLRTPTKPTNDNIYYDKEQEATIKVFFAKLLPVSCIWYNIINFLNPSSAGVGKALSWYDQAMTNAVRSDFVSLPAEPVENSDFDLSDMVESIPSVNDVKEAIDKTSNKLMALTDKLDRLGVDLNSISGNFINGFKAAIGTMSELSVDRATVSSLASDVLSTISMAATSAASSISLVENSTNSKFGYSVSSGSDTSYYSPADMSLDGKSVNMSELLSLLVSKYNEKKDKGLPLDSQVASMASVQGIISSQYSIDFSRLSEYIYLNSVLPLLEFSSLLVYTGLYYFQNKKDTDLDEVVKTIQGCNMAEWVAARRKVVESAHWDDRNIRSLDNVKKYVKENKDTTSVYTLHPFGVAMDVDFQECISPKYFDRELAKLGSNPLVTITGSKKGILYLSNYNQRVDFCDYMNRIAPTLVPKLAESITCSTCRDIYSRGFLKIQIYDRHFHYDVGRNASSAPVPASSLFLASTHNSSGVKQG